MMKILKFLTLPTLLAAVSCGSNSPAKAPSVHVDTRFTTLYSPDSNGVTGSDGAISIVLDDGSSLFMTGDCFLGEVVGGKRDFSYEMINNSLIHISADSKYLGAYYGGTPEAPRSFCTPLEAATSQYVYWYWPGHGFQHGNTLHLFMTKFYQGGEGQGAFA